MTTATVTIPAELAERAALAWQYMTQPEGPMPAYAALDWVMDGTTDDRQTAILALYGAAAASAPAQPNGNWFQHGKWTVCELSDGDLERAASLLAIVSRSALRHKNDSYSDWLPWCDAVALILALCREIEACP